LLCRLFLGRFGLLFLRLDLEAVLLSQVFQPILILESPVAFHVVLEDGLYYIRVIAGSEPQLA
jgi:hypothetical protein